ERVQPLVDRRRLIALDMIEVGLYAQIGSLGDRPGPVPEQIEPRDVAIAGRLLDAVGVGVALQHQGRGPGVPVDPESAVSAIRSTSRSETSCASQKTPENSGEYTVRPSIITSSLLASTLAKPRAVMAYWFASARATSRLGASRNASASVFTPERRMSSAEITYTDAAASERRSARRDTVVTSTSLNCSSERVKRLSGAAGTAA